MKPNHDAIDRAIFALAIILDCLPPKRKREAIELSRALMQLGIGPKGEAEQAVRFIFEQQT